MARRTAACGLQHQSRSSMGLAGQCGSLVASGALQKLALPAHTLPSRWGAGLVIMAAVPKSFAERLTHAFREQRRPALRWTRSRPRQPSRGPRRRGEPGCIGSTAASSMPPAISRRHTSRRLPSTVRSAPNSSWLLTIRYIRERAPTAVVKILNAKRGDIGNTAQAYAREAFDRYGADAVTVILHGRRFGAPILGAQGSRRPPGSCRTSNVGGEDFQDLMLGRACPCTATSRGARPPSGMNSATSCWWLAPRCRINGRVARGASRHALPGAGHRRPGWRSPRRAWQRVSTPAEPGY